MITVTHAPHAVGGNAVGLSKALVSLGVKSETVVFTSSRYGYEADRVLWDGASSWMTQEYRRVREIIRVCVRSDVVHFNFGTTFSAPFVASNNAKSRVPFVLRWLFSQYRWWLQALELRVYRLFRVLVFMHYQGDDIRQGDVSREVFLHSIANHVDEGYYCARTDRFKRKQVQRLGKYVAKMYSVNPDLMRVLPQGTEFIGYSHVFPSSTTVKSRFVDYTRKIKVAHAPTNRDVKGTPEILSALEQLKTEGFDYECVLIEGMTHEETLQQLGNVDVLLDQIYAGWYGGVAVEAMMQETPVAVYLREEDLGFLPREMADELPMFRLDPSDVVSGLRTILRKPREELLGMGRESRRFAEKWHNPMTIAKRIKADYISHLTGRAPS